MPPLLSCAVLTTRNRASRVPAPPREAHPAAPATHQPGGPGQGLGSRPHGGPTGRALPGPLPRPDRALTHRRRNSLPPLSG